MAAITPLLTLRQIHEATGYSMSVLYALIARGELATIRTSKKLGFRVRPEDWEAWVQRNRTPAKHEVAEAMKGTPRPAPRASSPVLQMRGADRYAG